jgi:glycosyltransferase involved in cell wall biosynthesis
MPRITVVLPVYNHERYVKQALHSIFAQDFSDFEIVAVDDGSTDASLQMLDRYRSRIKVIHGTHGGPAAARNRALAASDSQYVAFMDADDTCEPQRLRLQLEKLERESLDLVASGLSFMDALGQPMAGGWTCPSHARNDYWGSLLERNWIGTPSVMLRREILDSAGLFDESFTHSEDYDLWLRIARSHSIGYIDKPLIHCRRHSTNTSGDTASHQRFERLALQKVEALEAWKAFTRLYSTPDHSYEAWIWFLLRSGNSAFAEEASTALGWHPRPDSIRFAVAVFQYDSGQYEQALATFQSMSDVNAACLNNIGVLTSLCGGDVQSAVSRFDAALRLCPEYHDARSNLTAGNSGRELRLTRRPFRESLVPFVR